jgi:D-serine deaminase-like pyridoxal phosphate-dependent protein
VSQTVSDLGRIEISANHKGFPIWAHGATIESFLATKPHLFTSDFQFPVMIVHERALDHNVARMAKYCHDLGVSLAPHAKTSMSPQIAARQVDAGAYALTVANFNQANIFLNFGFKRIFIANEVVERSSIREIARQNANSEVEIIFYIDSFNGLKIAQDAIFDMHTAKLDIFLEIGAPGGRTGIRSNELLAELLVEIAKDARILIRGVSGFEGAVPGGNRDAEGIEKLRIFLRQIVASAKTVAPYLKGEEMIITAGGSSFFDYVVEEFARYDGPVRIVLRSGGYVSHDSVHYEGMYPFMSAPEADRFLPALEIWARVLSIPEPELAILNYGKRDVGNDLDNPVPTKSYSSVLSEFEAVVEQLNDQHAFMAIKKNSLKVGDIVGAGISHPCTNFDKWRLIPVVSDNYDVVDCVHTFF